eukprot:scaffold248700_cov21-Tisochrysis_lutea.AAC.3
MEWCSGHSGEYTGDLGTRAPEGGVFWLEAAQPCRRPFLCVRLQQRVPQDWADGVLVACGSTFLVFIGVFGEDIAPRINPCMH